MPIPCRMSSSRPSLPRRPFFPRSAVGMKNRALYPMRLKILAHPMLLALASSKVKPTFALTLCTALEVVMSVQGRTG